MRSQSLKQRPPPTYSPTFNKIRKVKLNLFVPSTHIGGAEVRLHSFLTSDLDGDEWLNLVAVVLPTEKKVVIKQEAE